MDYSACEAYHKQHYSAGAQHYTAGANRPKFCTGDPPETDTVESFMLDSNMKDSTVTVTYLFEGFWPVHIPNSRNLPCYRKL